jgi:uncharacterized protein (TIGR00369 family)
VPGRLEELRPGGGAPLGLPPARLGPAGAALRAGYHSHVGRSASFIPTSQFIEEEDAIDGSEIIEEFIKHSPFAQELGLELTAIDTDTADVRLPFRPGLATYGPVLHGGAIAAAADVAAMAASFGGVEFDEAPKGATVGFNVSYLTAVRESDITARARVVRRGSSLNFVDVDVLTDEDELAARAHVIYKLN